MTPHAIKVLNYYLKHHRVCEEVKSLEEANQVKPMIVKAVLKDNEGLYDLAANDLCKPEDYREITTWLGLTPPDDLVFFEGRWQIKNKCSCCDGTGYTLSWLYE